MPVRTKGDAMAVGGGGIWGFAGGLAAGLALAVAYVHWGISPPALLEAPARLKGNLVATAVEERIYDLDATSEEQGRALEVFIQNRPKDAVALDAELGRPLLLGLQRERARREAVQMLSAWAAFDAVLAEPGLRTALERKHGTTDATALKQAMLAERIARAAYLAKWLARDGGALRADQMVQRLRDVARK